MRTIGSLALGLALTALLATEARAGGEQGFLVIDSTLVKPLGENGRVSNSLGYGGEFRMLDNREVLTLSVGGFVALGQHEDGKTLRDIYDFHFNVAFKPERTRHSMFIPFLGVGLNVLGMETREDKGDPLRGTTLGLNARAGFLGHIGDDWLWRVSASYLGAIVPGTGDDLGGLVLQVGFGRAIFD